MHPLHLMRRAAAEQDASLITESARRSMESSGRTPALANAS
jgi:hypothetical protein